MEIIQEENGARYIVGLDTENNKLDMTIVSLLKEIDQSKEKQRLLNLLLLIAISFN